MSLIVSLITNGLQFIVNMFFVIIDFISYIIQSLVQFIWQNFFTVIWGYIKEIGYALFRASPAGYTTETELEKAGENIKKVSKKIKRATKNIRRLSRYDKRKIV